MPDHLIGIGIRVMVVSRAFVVWSTCALYAICVSIKWLHCPSSSCTRRCTIIPTQAQLYPQLPYCISTLFRAQHSQNAAGTTGIHMMSLIPAVIVFVTKKIKAISWSYCHYFATYQAACGYQIILWRPSPVVIDVGALRKVRGYFWNMRHGDHLPSRPYFGFGWTTIKKNRRKVGKSSVVDPERGLLEGPNFKEEPQFLKSNRISLVFDLTSNKDHSCMNESCFVFLLYRICRFCAIFGHFVGMAAYCPLDPPLKVVALRPRLMRLSMCMCTPTTDVGGIFRDGCIRLGYPSFSASVAPWSPKAAPAASDIWHAQRHPGWRFGLAETPDTSEELSCQQEANTHPRKTR